MDKAKKQAESIDQKDRLKEIENNLLKSANLQKQAAEQLNKEIQNANNVIAETVRNSGLEMTEQQKLMSAVQEVNNLLARARKGENVIEELKKLKL